MKKKKKSSKTLEIVESEKDKKMFQEIIGFLEKYAFSTSPIQIENFVLNSIEFPTPYSKFEQTATELSHRYNQLIDCYYQIKEKQLKIEMKEREIENEKDEIKEKLLELQKEKLELRLTNQKAQVKKVLKEARIFYKIYKDHPEFHSLTEKEIFKLQAESWSRKTLNMPDVFYQRYGKEYLYKALGKEVTDKYLELQRKTMGLLPRELFEIKQLPEKKRKFKNYC